MEGHALCVFLTKSEALILFYCLGLWASVANMMIEYASGKSSSWLSAAFLFC